MIPQNTPRRAAIYTRVSSAQQEDNYSLATQEAACRDKAAALGYEVIGVTTDVMTGAELWERQGLSAVRALVQAGAVDAIICHTPSRLSREPEHRMYLAVECKRHDAEIIFVIGGHDDTPEGQLLDSVTSYVDKMERIAFRERSQRGLRARMDSGKLRPSNRPLYGYAWGGDDKATYAVDEDKAAVVRRLYASVMDGATLRGLADSLTATGVPTANGSARWSHSVIRTMLAHPGYKGDMVLNGTTATKKGTVQYRGKRDVSEHIHLSIPPLVDAETWTAVQERLTRNRITATRNNQHPESFLLRAGFIVCGYCGKPIRAVWRKDCPNQDARAYYASNGADEHRDCPAFAMSAALLDDAVWAKVDALIQEGALEKELQRISEHPDTTRDEEMTCEKAIAQCDRTIANLSRALGGIDDADVQAGVLLQLKEVTERKRGLETELEKIAARWILAQSATVSFAHIRALIHPASDTTFVRPDDAVRQSCSKAELSYAQKRDVLSALGIKVRLYRKDHEPRYEIEANVPLVSQPSAVLSPSRSGRRASARRAPSFRRAASRRSDRLPATGHVARSPR